MDNSGPLSTAKLNAYWRLMRADKPIGIYLLLWPCVWALWIASAGFPDLHILVVFVLGVVVMRSAGCVINDYADRKVDGLVERSSSRPLVAGDVTEKEALGLFFILLFCAFLLVLTLTWQTVFMSVGGLILATIYPFMKRYTHLPQVVLGAAFGWSIPMVFVATGQPLNWIVWTLYFANLAWTVAYDTEYAMVDKNDDIKVGVKSTAILFGQYDKLIILLLQITSLLLLAVVAVALKLSWPFYIALVISIGLFLYQHRLIKDRDRNLCFKAFLHNHYVGLVFAIGIIVDYSIYPT
ncbi:4-hydroxybenzoate octaprenyltransferase [Paraglaciecola arctica]|uniref:4-hydroxybenzoate octaprenyltransferase n=1 Tax=Paraglaciecola arctica BSs20135 TaxID=493475 RepID=K6YYT0_9ALTE|nr:4-hydroxybenzoate octaprenyltransferase [Paraglaciecola arctica]GAC21908.1 4-hydroxybenzoate octaprenyltransferase [Paraglaciecola arctica BSs20135]